MTTHSQARKAAYSYVAAHPGIAVEEIDILGATVLRIVPTTAQRAQGVTAVVRQAVDDLAETLGLRGRIADGDRYAAYDLGSSRALWPHDDDGDVTVYAGPLYRRAGGAR